MSSPRSAVTAATVFDDFFLQTTTPVASSTPDRPTPSDASSEKLTRLQPQKPQTSKWKQIDAQLYNVIKSTLHPDVKPIFRQYLTCESVWNQANALYTNDTQRLYGVCHCLLNIITAKIINGSISSYLGTVHSAVHDFNEFLPPAANNPVEQKNELDQCNTFFMLLKLYGLPQEYSTTRDQILGSVTVPDMSTTSTILLRVPGHNNNRSQGGLSNSKPRPKCEHCNQLGHAIDRCWKLHGKPSINATQLDPSATNQTTSSPRGSPVNYEDFLRWIQSHPNSRSPTSIAHTSNSSVYLSHSSSLSLGSQGVGTVQILPSISDAFVLYVHGCPSNLLPVVIHIPPIRIPIEHVESAPQPPRPLQTYQCRPLPSVVHVLVPITDSPHGKSLVGCRWLYTMKVGPDGKIDRFKARLVAKGLTHIFGLDYSDTFSPVAKMEVYMEQPPRLIPQRESSTMVCLLHMSLYGLKQSPRAWFDRFSSVVQEYGMILSEADDSLFYYHSTQRCIYLIVYVDDIIITGSNQQGILQLKQHLLNLF
ncbi:uncharacterized protein [Cicer arietinum]|uniref:uncharacterized protein n=1 Tax=Cicer arietinum TaxID=3827 RepID=UPI003CC5CCC8